MLVKLQPVYRKVHKGLIRKYDWAFPIIGRVGKAATRVSRQGEMNPVFHASFLKPYHADQGDETRNVSTRNLQTPSFEKEVEWLLE